MFKVFEINNNQKIEVKILDGLYTVHELGLYQFEYSAININHNVFFIEDENISERYIKEKSSNNVITTPFRFFEDYFGFANIRINEESFQFNILGEKFELKEIEDIILYLFENNHLVLDEFVSKSSTGGENVYEGRNYLYSSKYLNLVDNFLNIFEGLFLNFKNKPLTVIRKKFELSNYSSQTIDFKSVEWVLQNLDTVLFESNLKEHPDVIKILNNYGVIDKIGADRNLASFATYENEIILGSFEYLKKTLIEIKGIIFSKLNSSNKLDNTYELSQYKDFRDLKRVPFLKLLKDIDSLLNRLVKMTLNYSKLFIDAKVKNQFPKLTPKFYKFRHYQLAFNQIKLLRTSEYNLAGEVQLLNVRKLSELYELYNLNILVEALNDAYDNNSHEKQVIRSEKQEIISKISFNNLQDGYSISLFYQPLINNYTKDLNLITIGNSKLIENHCKPDFVLEKISNNKTEYYILDAKYSKISTVKNLHLTACIKKYIIDVGIKNEPYQKPNWLILLHPDSFDEEIDLIYNSSHYPKIKTIISKPKHTLQIKNFIKRISEDSGPN